MRKWTLESGRPGLSLGSRPLLLCQCDVDPRVTFLLCEGWWGQAGGGRGAVLGMQALAMVLAGMQGA